MPPPSSCPFPFPHVTVDRSSFGMATRAGVAASPAAHRRPGMGKKLYVGNLAYAVTDGDLQQLFGAHGTVQSAQVIMDRDTGRSKGFGFVEMGSDQEAQAAIAAL